MAQLSTHLGKEAWEVPFGRVIYGDEALQSINTEYDDNVSQQRIWRDGYDYLHKEFPNLSYIDYCRVITDAEINYYLNNDKGDDIVVNNVGENDKEHDLQQQLYEWGKEKSSENNINNNQMIRTIFGGRVIYVCYMYLQSSNL